MLLAIDAGNTNIVFALLDGETIKARWRIATDARRTADEYAVWLSQLLALEGIGLARKGVPEGGQGLIHPGIRPMPGFQVELQGGPEGDAV